MNSANAQSDSLALLKAGQLQGCQQLKLSAGLTEIPTEIFELADSLEILDLTDNALSHLPHDFSRLTKLRILFCSNNQFTHLPEVLGECKNLSMIGFKANQISEIPGSAIPAKTLRWLIVTDNALKQVPNVLGDCTKLQKLMLAGNQLSALPIAMAKCRALELLRISANQFQALPEWLFDLPNLTWLAYAGNPFCDGIEQKRIAQHQVQEIDWQNLTLQQVLGQGASGVTYQAIWHKRQGEHESVAVKLFKSGLTSDGLPRCEMHANVLAGEHPNLVGIKGVVSQHPQGELGLVMPLLDSSLKVLAHSPSFETCTRDVYADGTQYSQMQVLHIASSVAKAVLHLHQQGMMHGDLYAHNILCNQIQVVLSDLGGVSLMPEKTSLVKRLKCLESRAFGVLLGELLDRSQMGAYAHDLLRQLQAQCMHVDSASRPDFETILAQLATLP
ncbi:MAG: leucine-rich repeat-containing protein kinase family protein [Methylophilus sp.]|nr:leucine-rich repeat-containing protein kinase family protein [Methylophilus sp.]